MPSIKENNVYHFKVDTNGVTFRAAGDPAPVLKNRETGEVAKDRTTGQTMYSVELLVKTPENRAEIWTVKVVGEPAGVVEGELVQVLGLAGQDWENGDRHGISWRAEAIVSASGAKTPPAPAGVPGGPPPPRAKAA
jgi:hypothetical protein